MKNINKQRGVVSLFVVVFTSLLIVIITVSFVRIMIQSQQQATTIDLSQSAYDSSLAGIEDAKRALVRYQTICEGNTLSQGCIDAIAKINSSTCNGAVIGLTNVNELNGEVKVMTDVANSLDQAYTCVKINLDTPDYLGKLTADQSNIIPLITKDNLPFNTVQIQWFSPKDVGSNFNNMVSLTPLSSVETSLLSKVSWPLNRPPIIRAQMIQVGSNFSLDNFDDGSAATGSNANTLFLYPTNNATGTVVSFISDARRVPRSVPRAVGCVNNLTNNSYSCTVRLRLPNPINGGDRTAFLRLSTFYNNANYRVTLTNFETPVSFRDVQPSIDSTGRANDLFRRTSTRVEFSSNFPYPNSAIEVAGNFCKNFLVTDDTNDYRENVGGPCTP